MTVVETALVFGAIPLVVFGVVTLAVFGTSDTRGRQHRYRPGKPWTYDPVWYLPHLEATPPPSSSVVRGALTAPTNAPSEAAKAPTTGQTATGGATGEW